MKDIDNNGCKHRWGERINNTAACKTCGAVALFDMEKDPFSESEPGILKPGKAQWDTLTRPEKKQAFERSKNYILADVKELGAKKASLKWGIKSTTWLGLMKRWLSPLETPLKPPSGPARQRSSHLYPRLIITGRPKFRLSGWTRIRRFSHRTLHNLTEIT